MSEAKMRHCAYCGSELGVLTRAEWYPGDSCGSRECARDEQDAKRFEREEAHHKLDRDMGWDDR